MVKKSGIIALIFTLLLITPSFAQLDSPKIHYWEDGIPYDADDLPIEIYDGEEVWCIDLTEEDESIQYILLNANYEIIEAKEVPYETYSNTVDAESTGWIALSAILPEDIDEDVVISITNGTDTYQYYLYSVNNYEDTVEVPAGTWSVLNCQIYGDDMQTYTAQYDQEVTIEENGFKTWSFDFSEESTIVSDYYTSSGDASGNYEETVTNNSGIHAIQIIMLAFCVSVIIIILVFFIRSNKEK